MSEYLIIGAVVGGATVLVLGLLIALMPSKPCPGCGKPLPKLRRPRTREQALHGGTTCPHCGCEVARDGSKVQKP